MQPLLLRAPFCSVLRMWYQNQTLSLPSNDFLVFMIDISFSKTFSGSSSAEDTPALSSHLQTTSSGTFISFIRDVKDWKRLDFTIETEGSDMAASLSVWAIPKIAARAYLLALVNTTHVA